MKQQRRPIDDDDDDEDDKEIIGSDDGNDEAVTIENKRVLRERKPVMNRIMFSSDEEADLDED